MPELCLIQMNSSSGSLRHKRFKALSCIRCCNEYSLNIAQKWISSFLHLPEFWHLVGSSAKTEMPWYIHDFFFFLTSKLCFKSLMWFRFSYGWSDTNAQCLQSLGRLLAGVRNVLGSNWMSEQVHFLEGSSRHSKKHHPTWPLRTDNILKWESCNEISVSNYWSRENHGGWGERERNCPLGVCKTKASFFFKILTVKKIT